jgi:hypothetical protein
MFPVEVPQPLLSEHVSIHFKGRQSSRDKNNPSRILLCVLTDQRSWTEE